ncbi:hypothetical protein GCM10007416_19920 [Kroppenstedtia guangzhouensis]|uniref:Uncharacterized protein n=2 Tax=Kroppenstedtia guangzhouensis TaxID=1274356 RepID=A0ABQ1GN25_9BACL|nr:hypothetical protein GCM10007416_19920 [Kroppenstedtia guangzhouensis]
MGASIQIRWTDFFTQEAAEKVAKSFEWVRRDEATDEILCGGNLHIFTENEWTPEIRSEIKKRIKKPGNGDPDLQDQLNLDTNNLGTGQV